MTTLGDDADFTSVHVTTTPNTNHATAFDVPKPPPPPGVYALREDARKLANRVDTFDDAADSDDALNALHDLGYLAVERALDEQSVQTCLDELAVMARGEQDLAKKFLERVGEVREAVSEGRIHVSDGGDHEALQYEAFAETKAETEADALKDLANVRKLQGFVRHSPTLAALAYRRDVLELVAKAIGGGVRADDLQIHQSLALLKPPAPSGAEQGGREKPFHQDLAYFSIEPHTKIIGAWFALDDTDEKNGCMHFIPRGHQRGIWRHESIRDWQIDDADVLEASDGDGGPCVSVPLRRGGAVIFNGLSPHGTPPNVSASSTRRAVQFHYHAGARRITDEERFEIFGGAARGGGEIN